jgi:Fe-S-cluster containining protein
MSTLPQAPEEPLVGVEVELGCPEWQMRTTINVTPGPMRVIELLPLANSLSDAVANVGVEAVQKQGEKISCKKGCGACCRQLVPISEVEARRIAEVVDAMPEPRQSEVRARFAAARQRFDQAGMLERLLRPSEWRQDELRTIGLEYFRQGVPCPFLEEESCSIYQDRPTACREYLVTTAPEHCANPTSQSVRCIPLPVRVVPALMRFDPVPPTAKFIRWVPLVLAPEWAESHPDDTAPRPGPELVRQLFDHLADKERVKLQQRANAMGVLEGTGEPPSHGPDS